MSNAVFECQKITKKIQDHWILKDISFSIKNGECFGLLGPNGAGKSTTLKISYGQMKASGGDVYILGLNSKTSIEQIKKRIGVVPQDNGLDEDLTVYENLVTSSWYFEIEEEKANERINHLLQTFKLKDHKNHLIDSLSGGLKKRVALARALLHDPELLILDEPTTGLDPQARASFWNFVRDFKAQGKSVLLTTHYMEEAEALCDRLAILDKGQVLSIGLSEDLVQEFLGSHLVEFKMKDHEKDYFVNLYSNKGFSNYMIDNQFVISFKSETEARDFATQLKSDHIAIRKPTLNDLFIKLSGSSLNEGAL